MGEINELNLQNPAFLRCLRDVNFTSDVISINLIGGRKMVDYFVCLRRPVSLITKNHMLDNHQVWHYLDFSGHIESLKDLESPG